MPCQLLLQILHAQLNILGVQVVRVSPVETSFLDLFVLGAEISINRGESIPLILLPGVIRTLSHSLVVVLHDTRGHKVGSGAVPLIPKGTPDPAAAAAAIVRLTLRRRDRPLQPLVPVPRHTRPVRPVHHRVPPLTPAAQLSLEPHGVRDAQQTP